MPEPARKRATYEDLLRLPEHLVAEIIDGELYGSPRPAPRHSTVSSRLGVDLGSPFDRGRGGPGGWLLLDEPELHLEDDVLVPDLAGWRRTRMAHVPDSAGIALAPDWVCEVTSPSTGRLDRVRKMPRYAHHGVAYLWLIDPAVRTLEVYRLEGGRWVLLSTHGADERVRAEPFDAVELELGALWADFPPEPGGEPTTPAGKS